MHNSLIAHREKPDIFRILPIKFNIYHSAIISFATPSKEFATLYQVLRIKKTKTMVTITFYCMV